MIPTTGWSYMTVHLYNLNRLVQLPYREVSSEKYISQMSICCPTVFQLKNELDNLIPTFSKTKETFLNYIG